MKITIGAVDVTLTENDPNQNAGLPFLYYKIEQSEELLGLVDLLKNPQDVKAVHSIYVQVPNSKAALEEIKKKVNL